MRPKIEIDVHIMTAGMGGGGKTTTLINLLAYLCAEIQDESTSILVIDAGQNTDFSAHWLPHLLHSDPQVEVSGHDYIRINMTGSPPIYAYQPNPIISRGLYWKYIGDIVDKHINELEIIGEYYKIIVLVDTGGAIGPSVHSAGLLKNLSSIYKWRIYPWILWSANSLTNENYITSSEEGITKIIAESNKINSDWEVHPVYLFIPIILDTKTMISTISRIASLVTGNGQSQITIIETLLSYKSRETGGEVPYRLFFDTLRHSFVARKFLDEAVSSFSTYLGIGRVLNTSLIDTKCQKGKGQCAYSNIFVIGHYDSNISDLKVTPGRIKNEMINVRNKTSLTESPIFSIKDVFGVTYDAYYANFHKYFKEYLGQN